MANLTVCGISAYWSKLLANKNYMTNKVNEVYEILLAHYGEPHWWPAKSPYEVIVGAILTQNTNWSNVEMAIANFNNRLSPQFVAEACVAELIEIIRPAGFFNQKAACLKAVTAWFEKYDYDALQVQNRPLQSLRSELLAIKGIGNETADCILLYAIGLPTFVIDAYTMRFCSRFPFDVGRSYLSAKAYFEDALPKSEKMYNNYHALIVLNGKKHCKKRANCCQCPLEAICAKF